MEARRPDATDDAHPDPVDARLDDALERIAHGATVSVPSTLLQRALTLAFTAVLTNGFAASPYGVFALARRLQRFLLRLALGFTRVERRLAATLVARYRQTSVRG